MKYFFLACLFPTLLTAETMSIIDELGKTVLYGDIAISLDTKNVAWVLTTAATTAKQIYVRGSSPGGQATPVNIEGSGERKDADPVWSPDSKTLAFMSTAGEQNEQRQLWTANADGSAARKITKLNGYAARPRWSHDGKQLALLYIEGASGGGPLLAHPPTTGVIDNAIHNQRIAVVDIATGELRQISPADLHIYDFDC